MLESYNLEDLLIAVSKESQNRIRLIDKKPKPFVKWIGGKRSILQEIKKYFPSNFNRYYEPFVGGGAIFFDLEKTESFISDLNLELITTYLVIKKDITKLIMLLIEHKKNIVKSIFII